MKALAQKLLKRKKHLIPLHPMIPLSHSTSLSKCLIQCEFVNFFFLFFYFPSPGSPLYGEIRLAVVFDLMGYVFFCLVP